MITLIGLLEISTLYDESGNDFFWIFKDIELDERLDKNVLMQEILRYSAKSHPIYDTCATFKYGVETFFKKWKLQIGKLVDTYYFEYNPIWNKDGTITENHFSERARGEDKSDDYNETDIETGNTENTVSAYNSSTYQPYDNTSTSNNRKLESGRDTDTDEKESIAENTKRIEQGNIGVTTTQSMISEERAIQEFNIYSWIADKFQNELFLNVW